MSKCQRYYTEGSYKENPYGNHTGGGYTQGWANIEFKQNMRASPTVATSGQANLGFTNTVDKTTVLAWTVSSSNTFFTSDFTWTADAEL